MDVVVVGLGNIGLPIAAVAASRGHSVVGVDTDTSLVHRLNSGAEPVVSEVPVRALVTSMVARGKLRACEGLDVAVASADVVVVCIPLGTREGAPDFGTYDQFVRRLGQCIGPDTLVSFETTLPVGTMRTRIRGTLERESGLEESVEFQLVYSPERVYVGRVLQDLRRYPKLIGGFSSQGAERGKEFYESILEFDERPELDRPNGVWVLESVEAAELAKLAESVYRDVNIALSNQIAQYAYGVGVAVGSVVEACNSQPYSHLHTPGLWVGGHCIPVYSRFYTWCDPDASIVATARRVNESMVRICLDRLEKALDGVHGKYIVVLGLSYRGNVKDSTGSGIYPIESELAKRGANAAILDPYYSVCELQELGFVAHQVGDAVDGVIVQADHDEFGRLTEADFPGVRAVLDGRAMLNPDAFPGAIYIPV